MYKIEQKRSAPCVHSEFCLSAPNGRPAVTRREPRAVQAPLGSKPVFVLSTASPLMCEAVSRWLRTRSC